MDQISENEAAIQNNTDRIKENADDIKENAIKCILDCNIFFLL